MAEKTISEQIVREAPEIEALKLGLLGSAKELADVPITYADVPGATRTVAGQDPLTTAAYAAVSPETGGIGGYEDYLTTGGAGLGTAATTLGGALTTVGGAYDPLTSAQTAASGSAGLFSPGDLSAYMNPYQQAVIDETMAEMNRQGALEQSRLAARAVGTAGSAFGGSRFGMQGAELTRNLQDARAKALADLNAQNYTQALQTAGTSFENQQRRQQAQSELYKGIASLYGQLGGQEAQIGQQQAGVAGQELGAAELAQTMGLKDIAAQQQMGLAQEGYNQKVLDAQYQNTMQQLYEPYTRTAYLSDIYKGAPSSSMILASQVAPSAPQPSTLQTLGSLGTGLLGTAAAAKSVGGLFN
tara:strand:- start:151 stop:1224 length:1074 start_codon:yes stop_codon:yes gene_type:complete